MLGIGLALQVAATAPSPPRDDAATMMAEQRADVARDEGPSSGEQRAREPYDHVFLGRLSLGVAYPRSSAHSELIETDGYDLGSRWHAEAAAGGVIFHRVLLGAYGALGGRSNAPSCNAPEISESVSTRRFLTCSLRPIPRAVSAVTTIMARSISALRE